MDDRRIMIWKGFGRRRSCPNWDTILAFAWGDWGISQKTSIRIAVTPAETWTEHWWNRSWERYHYANSSGYILCWCRTGPKIISVMFCCKCREFHTFFRYNTEQHCWHWSTLFLSIPQICLLLPELHEIFEGKIHIRWSEVALRSFFSLQSTWYQINPGMGFVKQNCCTLLQAELFKLRN
jgi:hypothetical protein